MGRHGEESSKSFRNGEQGEGRGYPDPQAEEIERQVDRKLNLDSEMRSTEEKQDRNTAEGGCATRVWFAQASVPVPQESSQATACALRHT